jgi:hypothetical protein
MKPWYVLIWALVVGVGGNISLMVFGEWREDSWTGIPIHIGIPIIIYFWLKKRQSKS